MTVFKRDFYFDPDYKKKILANIKKYRLESKIAQEQLSVDIGKSYDFVRRLEFKKGEVSFS